jgi:hypothetical protein
MQRNNAPRDDDNPRIWFQLSIDQHHPLVDDKDIILMGVDEGRVDGEYARLVDQLRNYLNAQSERSHDGSMFPRAGWLDKTRAFLDAFSSSGVESSWRVNVYSDVE